MIKNILLRIRSVAMLYSLLLTNSVYAQPEALFDAAPLVRPGDHVKYGSYVIYKIREGVYKINDPGVTTGKGGAWGVDMYLICGDNKALMIDLGNNYMDGYEKDLIAPRKNAANALREVIYGLSGELPLEIAITHAHPDHDGMTAAFVDSQVDFWIGKGEDTAALKTQHHIDPSVFKVFTPGEKMFDLGGERIVETFLVRGHSNGGTVFILKHDKLLFTGDALGSGFGQSFRSVDRLRLAAEDAQKLVEYLKAGLAPYDRYALQVYTGHTWQNVYGGFMHPEKEKVDVGYLDWRFIQDVASCANGILKGKWLVEGSGLHLAGSMVYTDSWPGAAGQAIMIYGTGTIIVPLHVAYEAAGLKIPE